MTEIERLEAEIAERKARLSKLKKEKRRGERLCFTQLRDGLSDDNISVFLFEQAIDKVRRFVVMLARARKETLGNGINNITVSTQSGAGASNVGVAGSLAIAVVNNKYESVLPVSVEAEEAVTA